MALTHWTAPGVALASLCLALAGPGPAGSTAAPGLMEEGFLQPEILILNALAAAPGDVGEPGLGEVLDGVVDWERLSTRTFKDYCEETLEDYDLPEAHQMELVGRCRQQLVRAYRARLVGDLLELMQAGAIAELRVERYDPGAQTAVLSASGLDGTLTLLCHLLEDGDGWKVVDLTANGRRISKFYRRRYREILDRPYSLPVLTAELTGREYIVLEDFAAATPGQLPPDWGWRPRDNRKPKLYQVQVAGDRRYLEARDEGYSVVLLKYLHWNPRAYPIVTWCWRANALPVGGNERLNHANDSAAGLYVIFSSNWLGVFKQVKYVWSSTLPEGTVDRRPKIFRPWFFVVESGEESLGKWTFEQVNVYEDHRQVFGDGPADRTLGVGLLTDANNTHSYAEAFYADVRAWSQEAQDKGLIQDYCGCFGDVERAEMSPGSSQGPPPEGDEYAEEYPR